LKEHEIRSTIGGQIKRFYRKPGESIKALDPVAEGQNINKYRVEGLLDAQYVDLLSRPGLRNTLPGTGELAPQRALARHLPGHLERVQAVAVSKDARKPLVIAAGEDRTVRVWDRMTGEQKPLLRHPVAVGAVACTAPTASDTNYCLSGADDG